MEIKRIRSNVEMLPTGKEMNIGTDKHWFTGRHLIFNEIEQHLYFTTDEEIKEGDWYINSQNKPYLNRAGNTNFEGLYDKCKKIVSTTDSSLGLPQPTTAFIKKYVELAGIDEVDLEYEDKGKYISEEFGGIAHDTWIPNLQLKVSHNTITIHAIKDSWSREEVIKLMEKYCIDIHRYTINSTDFNNWIKENL